MIYADTNFYMGLYVNYAFSAEAQQLLRQARANKLIPLPFTRLLRLELINGIEQWVFASRTSTQATFSQYQAQIAQATLTQDLAEGKLWSARHLSEHTVDHQFEELALRHTAKHGFRAYDVLHVAQALALGCDTFWSFDAKARKLASLEGLKLNPLP